MDQKQLVTGVAVAVGVTSMYFFVVMPLFSTLTPTGETVTRVSSLVPKSSQYPHAEAPVHVLSVQSPETTFKTEDIIVGDGRMVLPGDRVVIHYVGTRLDGTVFDTTADSQDAFSFKVGSEEVIQGLDIGIRGMREGGTRRIVIPPPLGYGSQRIVGPEGNTLVPENDTLVFDVILMDVERPE